MKKNFTSLKDLKIKSFITILDKSQQESVQGGNVRMYPPYRISKWTVLETRGNLTSSLPNKNKK